MSMGLLNMPPGSPANNIHNRIFGHAKALAYFTVASLLIGVRPAYLFYIILGKNRVGMIATRRLKTNSISVKNVFGSGPILKIINIVAGFNSIPVIDNMIQRAYPNKGESDQTMYASIVTSAVLAEGHLAVPSAAYPGAQDSPINNVAGRSAHYYSIQPPDSTEGAGLIKALVSRYVSPFFFHNKTPCGSVGNTCPEHAIADRGLSKQYHFLGQLTSINTLWTREVYHMRGKKSSYVTRSQCK